MLLSGRRRLLLYIYLKVGKWPDWGLLAYSLVWTEVGLCRQVTLCKALQWATSISLINKLTNQFNEMCSMWLPVHARSLTTYRSSSVFLRPQHLDTSTIIVHVWVLIHNTITLCVVPLFYFHLFFSRFSCVSLAFFLVFMIPTCWYPKREWKRKKNARKTWENIQNASPTRENVSILHYALGKNASQLRFGRVLVAVWSRFGHVLVINLTKMQTQRIV